MEPIYVVVRNLVVPTMRTWFRWSIEGLEKVPRRGPVILAFNHISYLDPFVTAYAADMAGRRPRFLAKSELFDDKRVAWIMRGCNQIEVRRGTPSAPLALDHALKALQGEELIVIFPEGTVTMDPDLRTLPAKTGASRLAIRSGAPLFPCAVWGTANLLPREMEQYRIHLWPPRQDLAVRIGDPIDTSGYADSPESWRKLGAALMEEISDLVASLRPAVPDVRRRKSKSVA